MQLILGLAGNKLEMAFIAWPSECMQFRSQRHHLSCAAGSDICLAVSAPCTQYDMQAGVSGFSSEYLRGQLGNTLHLSLKSTVSHPGRVL